MAWDRWASLIIFHSFRKKEAWMKTNSLYIINTFLPNEISIFRIAAGPSPEEIRQMKLKQRRASQLLKLRYTYIYIYNNYT